jgi:1-aminocyclopropane-1-carboxylate synthase
MSESTHTNGLSSRGLSYVKEGGIRKHFATIWENVYDADINPTGVINLGTAENYIMMSDAARFVNEKVLLKGEDLDYGAGPWGSVRLRSNMAKFMTKYLKARAPVNPDNVLFATGCTSIFDMLGEVLFEPGEGILLSRPIYQAFQRDFKLRARNEFLSYLSMNLN